MTTSQEAHKARRVLQRFVCVHVAAYLDHRAHQSLSRLESAFHKASAHRRFHPQEQGDQETDSASTRRNPEQLVEKRRELERKYSTSCLRPPSPSCDDLDALDVEIVHKSSWGSVALPEEPLVQCNESAASDDDAERSHHQHVTFEVVVQHLHTQLSQSRDELAAKDRRIRALEAHVASLELENNRLQDALGRSLKATAAAPLALASNQVVTT